MKKGLWFIFKCQNCGKVFQEKEQTQNMNRFNTDTGSCTRLEEYAKHIGAETYIVSTHKCKDGVYRCAKLIGCQIWGETREAKVQE